MTSITRKKIDELRLGAEQSKGTGMMLIDLSADDLLALLDLAEETLQEQWQTDTSLIPDDCEKPMLWAYKSHGRWWFDADDCRRMPTSNELVMPARGFTHFRPITPPGDSQ